MEIMSSSALFAIIDSPPAGWLGHNDLQNTQQKQAMRLAGAAFAPAQSALLSAGNSKVSPMASDPDICELSALPAPCSISIIHIHAST